MPSASTTFAKLEGAVGGALRVLLSRGAIHFFSFREAGWSLLGGSVDIFLLCRDGVEGTGRTAGMAARSRGGLRLSQLSCAPP